MVVNLHSNMHTAEALGVKRKRKTHGGTFRRDADRTEAALSEIYEPARSAEGAVNHSAERQPSGEISFQRHQ
ncbi:hypothetical protein SKAU_G00323870 [Synaphobranchus kaupii]|uniref:Uncharacterized protein n=1 Tax=Synaphobranchus kaupii TaxID=118154 RepID=A0A9Q1EPB7_SYNKA|nr:hypothetical protein SKAU_G00323870 [Synaphobranchus kaupii]